LRRNAIQRIARQQARETLYGWGLYATVAVAVLIAAVLVFNSVRFAGESGLNVVTQPFLLPLRFAIYLALLYVTVEAALAIARPREQGALQVLFFAPIDVPVLNIGYLLAGLMVFGLFLLLLIPSLLILAWVTNFVFPTNLLWGLAPSLFVAGVTIAFGLFISAAAPSGRSAVLLLVAALLILLAIQGIYAALLNIPPTSRFFDALLLLRLFLRNIQGLLAWVSPFHMLDTILAAALRADWLVVLRQVGIALIGTIFWLAASIGMLRRRGVLP
jgi:hypothetical protein